MSFLVSESAGGRLNVPAARAIPGGRGCDGARFSRRLDRAGTRSQSVAHFVFTQNKKPLPTQPRAHVWALAPFLTAIALPAILAARVGEAEEAQGGAAGGRRGGRQTDGLIGTGQVIDTFGLLKSKAKW